MADICNMLHKSFPKQDLLFNQMLFHSKIVLIALFCSLTNSLYAQTDYAELEWVRTYRGPDSNDSISKGMALDKEGNIYVAIDDIATTDSGFSYDYVLVKYDNDGNEKWTARYPASKSISTTEDMVNDKQDNLYIAGSADHRTKYVILKYNHSGALQWANISDADNPPLSKPAKIAVDDSGNVFMVSRTGDIFKYDTDGNQIWYQKDNHDERYTMALDNNSNIYVAGTDLVTKYNSDGVKQWEVIDTLYIYYSSSIIEGDNVYLCGSGLTKYSLEGIKQWSVLNTGYHMTVDNDGNPITFGNYQDRFRVTKFDTNGVKLWESFIDEYPSFYPFSASMDICTDRFNNIYILAYIFREGGNSDIATIKFSPSGKQKWIMRYHGFPEATAIAPNVVIKSDSIGNVYITAVTVFRDRQEQVVTIKYRQPNFPVSVSQENVEKYSFQLFQNYPNPFNPQTNIQYSLQETGHVRLDIINLQGQTIKRLVDEEKGAGIYNAVWDGQTDKGFPAASGIYICRVSVMSKAGEIPKSEKSIKLMLIK